MFKSADLTTFAKNEQAKYFEDMHTKEDIERMIDYAREEGLEKGMEKEKLSLTKSLRDLNVPVETIAQATGLSQEEIMALK